MTICRVLILDHQPLFAEAVADTLRAIPSSRVSVHVSPADLNPIRNAKPDVILLDPCVEGKFLVELIERCRSLWPLARLVILTDYNETPGIVSCFARGAYSFLLKSEPPATIRSGLEAVCRGLVVLSLPPALVLAAQGGSDMSGRPLEAPAARALTPREIQVLQLVARGYTDAEMAELLRVSRRTVQRHIGNILNKLDCRNRSQAVARVTGSAPPLVRRREITVGE